MIEEGPQALDNLVELLFWRPDFWARNCGRQFNTAHSSTFDCADACDSMEERCTRRGDGHRNGGVLRGGAFFVQGALASVVAATQLLGGD
jgi:hypothetical protein